MKTKILIIMLFASQLVIGQFGDELMKKELSKYSLKHKDLNIKTYGSCKGECLDSEVFNPTVDATNFNVSHGTPTFSNQGVWMWSYRNRVGTIRGEGVYTPYRFEKGKKYCVEMEVVLSRTGTTEPINTSATFNLRAANNITSSAGFGFPTVGSSQSIISGSYTSYPLNTTLVIRQTFTANSNFNQLWMYPRNPGNPHPQLNMMVRRLNVKKVVSCPCEIEGNIRFKKKENCEYQFLANASGANSSTRVTGYLWDFGDGTTSTDQNPIHIFPKQGTYYVTLTILGINDDGECCTKTITTRVSIREKCPQICETQASFKVVKKGWWFSRNCDFINTSTSNVVTTIVGYEWYIDGVLVSTDKDIKNYRGRGKKVCLKVYGIDRNGNCCHDEYCFNLRR